MIDIHENPLDKIDDLLNEIKDQLGKVRTLAAQMEGRRDSDDPDPS